MAPHAPLLVVSPHLDDAVFSCGNLLAAHPDSVVATIMSADPPDTVDLTDWDRQCGFASSRDAMIARREEDRAALTLLSARPLWLDFQDRQYGMPPQVEQISAELMRAFQSHLPRAVLLPLGLFHSDHVLTHLACVRALAQWQTDEPPVQLAYEDSPYRASRGLLQQRLISLAAAGVAATPVHLNTAERPGLKAQAVQCYGSQLKGLAPESLADMEAPERYWALQRAHPRFQE